MIWFLEQHLYILYIMQKLLSGMMILIILQLLSLVAKYAHHVVMNTFLNANNFRNKDLRYYRGRSDHHVFLITSSGISLSKIFVSKVFLHFKKLESSWSILYFCLENGFVCYSFLTLEQ